MNDRPDMHDDRPHGNREIPGLPKISLQAGTRRHGRRPPVAWSQNAEDR